MAKLTDSELARYRAMDREAFDFAETSVAEFFAQRSRAGIQPGYHRFPATSWIFPGAVPQGRVWRRHRYGR